MYKTSKIHGTKWFKVQGRDQRSHFLFIYYILYTSMVSYDDEIGCFTEITYNDKTV